MDEKALEEIQFHTETIVSETNSPLHLIREKEMEISGRVLTAKKQAEEIVAEARRTAVTLAQESEAEVARIASEREREVRDEIEREAIRIAAEAEREIAGLEESVGPRVDAGAELIVRAVVRGEA